MSNRQRVGLLLSGTLAINVCSPAWAQQNELVKPEPPSRAL
jgi:hypothetical protein